MTDFIGRGEERAVKILEKLFPSYKVIQQMPIKNLLNVDQYRELGEEYRQHKHDIVLAIPNYDYIIIEINYKHGKKANEKWEVYKTHLEVAGHRTVTIEEEDCKSLFLLKDGIHTNTWQDWIDVIQALKGTTIRPS